jgi:hypothetical protein
MSTLPLVVRFSTSLPDLELSIPSPHTTTLSAIKRLIRSHVPELATRHLRLIYAGKVLLDQITLSSLQQFPREEDTKGKGKAVDSVQPRLYIQCAPGQELSAPEKDVSPPPSPVVEHVVPTQAAPRGFDRLLSAGFSPTEVAALRASFTQLHLHSHTPDTAPSVAEMRLLEERWMDSTTADTALTQDDVATGEYEDLFIGVVLGFLWPFGAVVWILREEGVWSSRRRMAVIVSLLINCFFSMIRVYGWS